MKSLPGYTFCLFMILSLTACNQNRNADIDTSLINTSAPQNSSPSDSSAVVAPLSALPTTANEGALLALNPPHGQPGHDCAVPVGQPLNGKTNTTTPQVTNRSAPQIINAAPLITPVVNNNGSVFMNPPHGQPGHDCSIPVGQPLNGKSSTPSPQPAAPTTSPVVNAAPQILPLPNGDNSVALNPAHGLPGHDCAIPVGQPLK